MLYERECGVVVMLCGCEEGETEMCAQYWPATAGTMMKYGEFVVSTVSINDTKDGFIQRAITITDTKVRNGVIKDLEIQLCARIFLFARLMFLQLDHSDFDLSMTAYS